MQHLVGRMWSNETNGENKVKNKTYQTCPVCTEHNRLNGLRSDDCHLVSVTPMEQRSCRLNFLGACGHMFYVNYRQSEGVTEITTSYDMCAHANCANPVKEFMCFDDHDSNAGTYYVSGYCSLECFVCDLKHASDGMGDSSLKEILSRITA
jgi:hypothetical protein